jgi:hypothetical protein
MLIPGTHGKFHSSIGTVLPVMLFGGRATIFVLDDNQGGGLPGNHLTFKGLNLDPSKMYLWIDAQEEKYFVPDFVQDDPERQPSVHPLLDHPRSMHAFIVMMLILMSISLT